jgi:UDP-N-acetylglucosamine 2-epimerase (non-hydrolysing)
MKQLALVAGARPNFMKAAPLIEAVRDKGRLKARLIHTGQHFDANMSQVFFTQLGMPEPDLYLDIHGGSQAQQVGRAILELEKEFSRRPPDMVVVFGDVNSTLAAAVTANKLDLPLAHVEAGLRSFDRSMPEEHNRIATDMLADLLFTPSVDADKNLRNEGVSAERIFRVGNIMVDSLMRFKTAAEALQVWKKFGVEPKKYGLVTLHRPSNVDEEKALAGIVGALVEIQKETPLIFPVHPRSRERLASSNLLAKLEKSGVRVVEPIGYLEFLSLMTQARFVLTDSGGIQEESTVLGVPCLTARENTERPITLEMGNNRLVGNSTQGILDGYRTMLHGAVTPRQPDLWDGKTAGRIEAVLAEYLS